MPRLLSNKSPKKISASAERSSEQSERGNEEVKVEEKKSEKKSFEPPRTKSVEEMTAWEYYNHIMRFGKKKMNRSEWCIWKEKKDLEEILKGYVRKKPTLNNGMSSMEYAWRLKKDPHFVDTIAREEFALDFNKNGAWR